MTGQTRRLGRMTARDRQWMRTAACVEAAAAMLPWTADVEDTTAAQRLAMAAVCGRCPVLADCAAYAKAVTATGAFWAGRHRDDTGRVVEGVQLQMPWAS